MMKTFKPGSPNLDQRCETFWLGSCFAGWLAMTFKVKFNLEVKIYLCWVSLPEKIHLSLDKIHNSHDSLDYFTDPTVSQSQSSARTYITSPLHAPDCFTNPTLCTCRQPWVFRRLTSLLLHVYISVHIKLTGSENRSNQLTDDRRVIIFCDQDIEQCMLTGICTKSDGTKMLLKMC